MAGIYPLATLAAQITPNGVTAPTYADCLATFQAWYQGIYGSDVVLDNSTQDGQWIAIQAKAYSDVNAAIVAVYNQFSPATAVGTGLSSIVKTNGIQRETPSNSTADIVIVAEAGTDIVNGIVGDSNSNQWALPASVVVGSSGTVTATATCTVEGAVTAAIGTISKILTPTYGWQTATNPAAATPGAPVEQDPALRQRQAASTALPALTPFEAIVAAVENLPGVTRVAPYKNDTNVADANGLPPHSISLVVEGGDAGAICAAIASKKLAAGTYGNTSEIVIDQNGVPTTINFWRPVEERLVVNVDLTPLTGYVSTTGTSIQEALVAYVAALPIGTPYVYINKLISNANIGGALGATYNIPLGGLSASIYPASPAVADIALAFNAAPSLSLGDITVTP